MVRFLKGFWLAVLMTAVFFTAPASAQIGVASVVKQKVSGTIGGRTRVLQVGTNIFQNEVIDTGDTSSAQLLFRDETSLTIGSNAQLVLDRFVYDPRSKRGDVVVSVAKGAFRFVTGSADPRSYKIKTPVASIGIRGTIFEAYIDALGNLFIVVIEGAVDLITATGKTISLKAGEYATVSVTDGITGPGTWTGPTLNLNAFVRFVLDNLGNLLGGGGDPLPRWNEFNDALDSRDIDITFPPGSGSPPGGPVKAPAPPDEPVRLQSLQSETGGQILTDSINRK